MFFINGGAVATWASRIPTIQEHLTLSSGQLGVVLLSMAIGALLAMSIAGALASSIGSRPIIVWAMVFSCFALVFPAFAPNMWFLALSVVALGLFLGSMDVAMNAHAVAVERAYGQPIMSFFHALFSVGGIVFASFGAAMAAMRIDPTVHFCISAVVLLITGMISKRWLLPASADATGAKVGASLHLESLRQLTGSSVLLAAGVIMFCCFLVEGAMGDWSGVFLHQTLKTDPGFAALGYASFSATMCIGRLTGDAVNKAMGARNIVTFGSLIAIAGLTLVVAPLNPYMAVAGFALVGIGVANIVPIAFSCAGNAPNTQPGLAIASVSLMGYFGLLAGPPIVGFAAEALTLRVALCLLAVLAVTMICMAGRVSDSASEKLAKS
jgi:fucose permease